MSWLRSAAVCWYTKAALGVVWPNRPMSSLSVIPDCAAMVAQVCRRSVEAQVRPADGYPRLIPPVAEGSVVERVAGNCGKEEPHPSRLGEEGQVRL